jgi:hypothetical protein
MWTNNSWGSGLEMLNTGNSFLLEILPASGSNAVSLEARLRLWSQIHPLLIHPNSFSFVFILRPGATVAQSTGNPQPISDPFFSATTLWVGSTTLYIPDMEATAIGCVEQFQVCFDAGFGLKCYPWMDSLNVNPSGKIMQDLRQAYRNTHGISLDYASVFWRSLGVPSLGISYLQAYLQKHVILRRPLLVTPLRLGPALPQAVWDVNATHQWLLELDALFTKAVLWQKILMLDVVQGERDLSNQTRVAPGTMSEKTSLCNRIILVDGDYTNIDWLWMWVLIGTLALLCIISYAEIYIPWVRSIFKWFREKGWPLLKSATKELWTSIRAVPGKLRSKFKNSCASIIRRRNEAQDVRMDNLSGLPEEEPDNPLPVWTDSG